MSSFDHHPPLSMLHNANSIESQITALRVIKNNITGHELRKADYIRSGLLPVLSRTLSQSYKTHASQSTGEIQDDTLWIYTTSILGSLAYSGPSFVQPILHSTIVSTLLTRLSPTTAPRLLLAILRCLNVIADNLPLSSPHEWIPDRRLANLLYTTDHATCFARCIIETSPAITSQQACDAILSLVCKTCTDDRQKAILVRSGVLSALVKRLATFVAAEGLVVPGLEAHGVDFRDRGPLPEPAPSNAHLSPVLETIGTIINSSKAYTAQLLQDPAIAAVLPAAPDDFSPADIRKSPWGATYFSGTAVPRSRMRTPIDLLLPRVPDPDRSDTADSFPPLGTNVPPPKRRSSSIRPLSDIPQPPSAEDVIGQQEVSLLVPWLLYLVRTYRGKRRILASRVLVVIFKHDLLIPSRARSLKTLVVPLLVQAIDQAPTQDEDTSFLLTRMLYTDAVPSILARLIVDDEGFQKVAVDGKAIAKLAARLKATFEPPHEKAALWRPWKQQSPSVGESIDCCLGPGGPSLQERHTMSYREGLLQALAAIAPFNDHYRKEICDQGVLTQVMLALEPFHGEASVKDGEDPSMTMSGNSALALLAACDVVRALTRSVTALRTKLVDADVGKAIIKLLHSTDPEVTIAATKVIANLAIDFSPMKPSISEPVLVKKLCEQAHSANAGLRLESIWALKHLVLKSSNKLKRDVINELGVSWIRHLIATDPYDIPPGEVIGLVMKEYLPRSAHYAGTGDVIMSDDSDDEDAVTVNAVRDNSDFTKRTVEDDLAIQEQLLDLLRNLFCGDNSVEIAEYVLAEVGYPEFIKIIMDRLRPKTTVGATRKANTTLSPPPNIAHAALSIIVHLAACHPKFRGMITSNPSLMRQILQFHQNPDRRIRAAVCWIAINLVWGDNPAERDQCRTRALEMNRAGYLSYMRQMEKDAELDVRERAKIAVQLLDKLVPKEIQR